jgi:hypothetical protein
MVLIFASVEFESTLALLLADAWVDDGALRIRNRFFSEACFVNVPPVEGWLALESDEFGGYSAGIEGKGGKGPKGGGKGAILGSGEAGIGFNRNNRTFPALNLREEGDLCHTVSSGRGGKFVDGGGLLGAIMDNLKPFPALETRFHLVGLRFGCGIESTESGRLLWRSLGAGGNAEVGSGRGGGGIEALCLVMGLMLEKELGLVVVAPDTDARLEKDGRLETTLRWVCTEAESALWAPSVADIARETDPGGFGRGPGGGDVMGGREL